MSFWQKQDSSAVENNTNFGMVAVTLTWIPNNTALIAGHRGSKWADYQGESLYHI